MITHEQLMGAFLRQYPYDQNVFVMMRYRRQQHFLAIEGAIRTALSSHGLNAHFAKDRAFHDILWDNIRVYMDSCLYGLAVFEEIDERDFNPNISLELGYMMAREKRCLLLKEKRMPGLPTDICGFLYRDFDIFDIENSIGTQIRQWVLNDLCLNPERLQVLRTVASILARRGTAKDHKRKILWLLHASADGMTTSGLKSVIYADRDVEGTQLRQDIVFLQDIKVITFVEYHDGARLRLTDLGREAVDMRKEYLIEPPDAGDKQ